LPKLKVCVVLVDRANYGRLRPVVLALNEDPDIELQMVCGGTMVLERFGSATEIVERDGIRIDGRVYMELEGSTTATMAKSVGLGIIEFSNEFQRLKPDIVLMIGDRYEALGAAIAAAYMNLTLVHVQGGEVSGSIDESARHAISKFAHYHVPSTARAAEYLVRMGEDPATILTVGCPSSDLARTMDCTMDPGAVNHLGSGAEIHLNHPYALAVFHPTTTEFGSESDQMDALLNALNEVRTQTILLWPNIDAGSDHISKSIRRFRDRIETHSWLRVVTNLEPEMYLKILANADVAVGNSSSFVRDAGYFGTPVVLVGNRQIGRERGTHVLPVSPTYDAIHSGIKQQLEHGRFAPSSVYGDGFVSERVVNGLKNLRHYTQKQLNYVSENHGVAA
jgi:UDP-hydrolysing UDP-N-acetyl-D-glucosamine 2-epimerase